MRKTDSKEQLELFDDKFWRRLSRDERTKRVMAKIFDFIHFNILEYRLFGAEGLNIETRDSKDGVTGIEYVDYALRLVERELEARGGKYLRE